MQETAWQVSLVLMSLITFGVILRCHQFRQTGRRLRALGKECIWFSHEVILGGGIGIFPGNDL